MKNITKKLTGTFTATALIITAFTFEPGIVPVSEAAENFISLPSGGFNSANTGSAVNKTVRISGDAALDGKGGVVIVPNAGKKAGGVFLTQPIAQGSGFSTSFKIRMGAKGGMGTGDGFVFVIANSTNQVGAIGQGIGYSGITKSIAIEYDTYDNKSGSADKGNTPHIWYGKNGVMDTSDSKTTVLFENSTAKRNAVNYDVYGWAEFDANSNPKTLKVTFSSSATRPQYPSIIIQSGSKNSETKDSKGTMVITDKDFDPTSTSSPYYIGSQYYMGFTGATGGAYQAITLQSFSAYGEYIEDTGGSKKITVGGKEVDVGTGLDLPKITPPSPPSETDGSFQGMYDENGVQYYDENGNGVHANDLDEGDVLYARFSYEIRLKNQGVADSSLAVEDNAQLPATVPAPVRDGYTFAGYYDDITNNAVCYYNGSGARQYGGYWIAGQSPGTLYAKWTKANVNVTVNLDGGTWSDPPGSFSGSASSYTATLNGGTTATLPEPTQNGKSFAGWRVSGIGGYVSADGKTFTADSGNVTLTAVWAVSSTSFVNNTGEDVKGDNVTTELLSAYETHNLSADPENGVTPSELATGNVSLTLYVENILAETSGATAIKDKASKIGGQSAAERTRFYDIYVEKDVDGDITRLKEIPETVTVSIPLTGNLLGATSYTVFHYHEGEVRNLYNDNTTEEYWEISGADMLIHVRKFSEFGILPNGRTIGPVSENDLADDPMNGDNEPGMDVQGKVMEGEIGKIYKLDIAWGAMKFEYSVGNEWNPDSHDYSGAKINEWIPTVDSTCYLEGNNQITTYNHSNDGVELTFTAHDVANYLDGVDIMIFTNNTDAGNPANAVPLERVAFNGDPVAPSVDTFVRLLGSPGDVQMFLDEQAGTADWKKVAVITVTIVPQNGVITPVS